MIYDTHIQPPVAEIFKAVLSDPPPVSLGQKTIFISVLTMHARDRAGRKGGRRAM